VNDEIYGIMELVSYNHFEQYKIEFIEKLCENIASVVSSVNTNIHNAHLLEQSNEQADELSQHEEEMRQNLEEMQATQEEAAKRHDTLNSQLMAFYNGLMVAEIDTDGKLMNMSKKMMRFYGINNESVEGMAYVSIVAQDDASREKFKDFWATVLSSGKGQRKMQGSIFGKDTYAIEYYKVIYKNDEPYRVIVISISKMREKDLADRLASELQSFMQEHGMDKNEA
jgi:Transcriptional regulator containing PAS, AAA-type ATPase, and DNA-binding domains